MRVGSQSKNKTAALALSLSHDNFASVTCEKSAFLFHFTKRHRFTPAALHYAIWEEVR
jgi:hypothetical protein